MANGYPLRSYDVVGRCMRLGLNSQSEGIGNIGDVSELSELGAGALNFNGLPGKGPMHERRNHSVASHPSPICRPQAKNDCVEGALISVGLANHVTREFADAIGMSRMAGMQFVHGFVPGRPVDLPRGSIHKALDPVPLRCLQDVGSP